MLSLSQMVSEMLSRKYDIMHQYPLFNLALYYSNKVKLEPLKDMIATGGLLDRSVEDHQSLVLLVGVDHILFSQWNYRDNREEQERQGREGGDKPSSNHHEETRDEVDNSAER